MRTALVSFAIVFGLATCALHAATAQVDSDARAEVMMDAGVATVSPTLAQSVQAPAIADPSEDPSGYAGEVQTAFKAGRWTLLVVMVLFGLDRMLLWAAGKWQVSWLKRYTPMMVAAGAVLTAIGASLASGGAMNWSAVLGAVMSAAALYLSPSKAS